MSRNNFVKIVLTGGPCAGKTTVMRSVKETLERRGYGVVIIPETATELISSGIAPWTMDSKVNYQKYQMMLQLQKENIYCKAAGHLANKGQKMIVLLDRAAMDNKAYLSDEEFDGILSELGICEKDILERYDAVFHLESCAKGISEMYTVQNNSARTETKEEAMQLDERISVVWSGHSYFESVKCTEFVEEKERELSEKIFCFLSSFGN